MADYRSRKIEVVNGKAYSAGQSQAYPSSFAHSQSYSEPPPNYNNNNNNKTPKSKPSKLWNFNDPEVKRRKRVASYKVYTVEGRVKATFRKSFRWIKDKYTEILQGW